MRTTIFTFTASFMIFLGACLIPTNASFAQEDEGVYPFEVKIGGNAAKYSGGPFAKILKPCASDAKIEIPGATNTVIINIFRVNPDGVVPPEAHADTKIIFITEGNTALLSDTVDKTRLSPGLYGANVVSDGRTSRVMFTVE